jgi:hypothetical protein
VSWEIGAVGFKSTAHDPSAPAPGKQLMVSQTTSLPVENTVSAKKALSADCPLGTASNWTLLRTSLTTSSQRGKAMYGTGIHSPLCRIGD